MRVVQVLGNAVVSPGAAAQRGGRRKAVVKASARARGGRLVDNQAADGQLQVTKDGGTINAITGATITSRAVTDGVNTAAAYVATLG